MATRICTVCPGFSTQSEFQWELHEASKDHQFNIDNFNRGVAWAEGQRDIEIEQLKDALKKVVVNCETLIKERAESTWATPDVAKKHAAALMSPYRKLYESAAS